MLYSKDLYGFDKFVSIELISSSNLAGVLIMRKWSIDVINILVSGDFLVSL